MQPLALLHHPRVPGRVITVLLLVMVPCLSSLISKSAITTYCTLQCALSDLMHCFRSIWLVGCHVNSNKLCLQHLYNYQCNAFQQAVQGGDVIYVLMEWRSVYVQLSALGCMRTVALVTLTVLIFLTLFRRLRRRGRTGGMNTQAMKAVIMKLI